MSTRVLVLADGHSGHVVGLTPPDWDKRPGDAYSQEAGEYKHRREIYKWLLSFVPSLSPDIVIYNGDAIEGKGEKSGGTELITAARDEQCDMAIAAIKDLCPHNPKIVMSYGTPYHVGDWEDWENQVAKGIGAVKIGSEDDIKINGKVINYRHHAGRSSIPHGRATPLMKEKLWNYLWALRGEYPNADVIIRSHNHYFLAVDTGDYLAIATPSLQGYGTKYASRRVLGTVDVGVVWLDIAKDGTIKWDRKLKRFNRRNKFALVVDASLASK